MAEDGNPAYEADHHHHSDIHMPPNSWIPVSVALAMALTFIGLVINQPFWNPGVWIAGAAWLLASLVAWVRSARSEYVDLPEKQD